MSVNGQHLSDVSRQPAFVYFRPALERATELTVQSERAFQKQPHIFLNSKTKAKSARPGKNGRRWYKDVGLGFRTPKTAIEGSYIGTWDNRNVGSIFHEERRLANQDESDESKRDTGLWS
ncbi:40S ribosomal protein S11-B [Beauveria bassiana]|uniref:40S ribosomal protein S11-B n=1 Tax=Beauveria bassiana TaxID=176275 RepID=A0A2N6NUA8_BEABA|nr:40S ribosomal protein S11-B [Beauveria bassiana]